MRRVNVKRIKLETLPEAIESLPEIPLQSHVPIKRESSQVKVEPINKPNGWHQIYDGIKKWRECHLAPVDTMGCDELADKSDPITFRYQTLVSLQLSSQTRDAVNADAMTKLKSHPDGFNASSVASMPDEILQGYISKVSFYRRKTIHLKQTATMLMNEYDGDIPSTAEDLMKLPGVGPKMAHLTMQIAWNQNSGIGVDTHVHRISGRLGWVPVTKYPEKTRKALEDWLPREYWKQVNHLLVGFGQTLCKPIGPLCSECPVKDLCPKIGTKHQT